LGLLLLPPLPAAASVNLPLALGLIPAAAVVCLVGLLDDLHGLRAWKKLLGQIAGASFAYLAGVNVSGVAGFAAHGWWSFPITVVWLVACSNAFNLIDGMDGLATGIGLFASFTTLAAALLHNNAALALATAPLVGALLAYGICGVAAAFSLLQTWPQNRFNGLLLVIFCAALWIGLRLTGYVEFDAARHLVLTGTFRHIVSARLFVDGFERKAAAAVTPEDYWTIIREVVSEFGFP